MLIMIIDDKYCSKAQYSNAVIPKCSPVFDNETCRTGYKDDTKGIRVTSFPRKLEGENGSQIYQMHHISER